MRILVPFDDSSLSQTIVGPVEALLRELREAEVHLLTVLDPAGGKSARDQTPSLETASGGGTPETTPNPRSAVTIETRDQALVRQQEAALQRLREAAAGRFADASVTCHAKWLDDAAEGIVRVAAEIDADMIAMATHARSGLSHLLSGSVTEAVIRASHLPVYVFRP